MGQEEILKIIEKKKEITAEEIAKLVDVTINSVQISLRGLVKEGDIERIERTREEIEALGKKYSGRHYKYCIKNYKQVKGGN